MYSHIRDETEIYYQKKKEDPSLRKLTSSELRIMTMKALEKAWLKMLQKPNVIIRSFQRTGLSLNPDGSQDADLMAFQGVERGIPPGLEI